MSESYAPLPDGFQWLDVPANGLRFDVLAAGPENGPPVLLLHGFPEFADAWTAIMEKLVEAGCRCFALQQRGYSDRARPSGVKAYGAQHLVADVLAVADALGIKSFHLVGHDWGGMLAWMIAAKHADRLLTLSVFSTPHLDAFFDALIDDSEQKKMSHYIAVFRLPGHIAEWLLLRNHAKLLRAAYGGHLLPAQLESYVRRFSHRPVLTAAINWYRALDIRTRVGPIHGPPTLFIWGTADHALGRVAAERTATFVDGLYHFEPLDGASHWLLEQEPDTCASLCVQHFARHRAQTL